MYIYGIYSIYIYIYIYIYIQREIERQRERERERHLKFSSSAYCKRNRHCDGSANQRRIVALDWFAIANAREERGNAKVPMPLRAFAIAS